MWHLRLACDGYPVDETALGLTTKKVSVEQGAADTGVVKKISQRMYSLTSLGTSIGVIATLTPASRMALIFESAVP